MCHAYLVNSNVIRSVRRFGNWNNGANAGFGNRNANNAPSNSNANYGGGLTLSSTHKLQQNVRIVMRLNPTNKNDNLMLEGISTHSSKDFVRNLKLPDWNGASSESENPAG